MFTILADRLECAELLLRAGANVNCKDKGGRTALHWAAHKVCGSISTKYGLIYLFIVYRSTSHLVFFNTVLKDYHYGEGCKIALCVKLLIGVCFCTNNFSSYPLPLTYVVHRLRSHVR